MVKICPDCKQVEGSYHIERKRGDHPISSRYYNKRVPAERQSWAGAIVGAVLVDDSDAQPEPEEAE